MTCRFWISVALPLVLLAIGCGPSSTNEGTQAAPTAPESTASETAPYVSLDDDLSALIDDFNAHVGKIRQIYISGPTCGICLRGLADMDETLVADLQDDPRLHTQVLHVPALGAEEHHVEPTIHLLDGPRVKHFWDGSGHSGLQFQEALGIPMYAWDVWMIYGPEATWEHGNTPPKPEFWQHQLGGLSDDYATKLDPDIFANAVRTRVDRIDPTSIAEMAPRVAATDTVEGDILRVEQPRGYVIQQHLKTRGGYRNLKKITRIDTEGTLIVGNDEFPLSTSSDHGDRYRQTVQTPEGRSVSSVEDGVVSQNGPVVVPADIANELLRAFEFDSWLMEWKDKGHQVWRLGMVRDDERLPWLMEVEHRNGQVWHLYMDSHTGDNYRRVLLDDQGNPSITVEFGEFKQVSGYRMAHSWSLSKGNQAIVRARHSGMEITHSEEDPELPATSQ